MSHCDDFQGLRVIPWRAGTIQFSEAALGTMTFGDEWGWGSPKAEAQKVYETYEAGGNFIDTANVYTNGTSERFVGEFIHGHRHRACTYRDVMKSRLALWKVAIGSGTD